MKIKCGKFEIISAEKFLNKKHTLLILQYFLLHIYEIGLFVLDKIRSEGQSTISTINAEFCFEIQFWCGIVRMRLKS